MLGFNHTLAGSIIALTIPAPAIPAVAYVSHFLLDIMPHFGRHPKFTKKTPGLKKLIVGDGIVCTVILLSAMVLFPEKWFLLAMGAFFAVLPDLQWIFEKWLKTPDWFLAFSSNIQWGERPWGWILEICYGVVLLAILIAL